MSGIYCYHLSFLSHGFSLNLELHDWLGCLVSFIDYRHTQPCLGCWGSELGSSGSCGRHLADGPISLLHPHPVIVTSVTVTQNWPI